MRAEDFYRPDHRIIFEAIGALAGAGKAVDVVTISEHLDRTAELDNVGGLAYLGSLARDTPTAANVRAYADIVRERSLLLTLILLTPVLMYDMLKFSHRIAGPLFRCRRVMLEMAEGKPVPEFKPRKRDLMRELFAAFNTLIVAWNARVGDGVNGRGAITGDHADKPSAGNGAAAEPEHVSA